MGDIQSFLDATVVKSKEADTKVELITTAYLIENPVAEENKKKKTKESLKRNLSQTQIKSFFKKTSLSPESNKKAKLDENIKEDGVSDLPPGWTRMCVPRKGSSIDGRCDYYLVTDKGERFRSQV